MGTDFALWTRSSSLSMRTRTSMGSGFVSAALKFFLQAIRNTVGYQAVDVAPEGGELLDAAGAEETVLRTGHQVERVDLGVLHPVELVHLELVLEVRDRPQALDDALGADLAREVDDEDVERLGADVAEVRRGAVDELEALLDAEDAR